MTKPLFGINSIVMIGNSTWTVVRYHYVNQRPEVMFRSERGEHKSFPLYQLERLVREAEAKKRK